jgi:glycogen operon protein
VRTLPGTPVPLGATLVRDADGEGVNFALFSERATRVELCLFDDPDAPAESARIAMPARSGDVWHGRVPGLGPGQLYGYRVHGPWAPGEGQRFNPNKLLVDPYARALAGAVRWDAALLGQDPADPGAPDARDSAPFVPKGRVVDPAFDWGDDRPPRTPWSRSVLYECHVKGMTQRHPALPEAQRGRFLGLTAPAVVEHWQRLGVTAVELLPVQHHAIDAHLASLGLPNYWGYMTLGFFAPDARFAAVDPVREFKEMVRALHRAGLEVILDVVYNHTPEGGHLGPTLSLRGIDNAAYYRLDPDDRSRYWDATGCGNTLNASHPRALQLVLDSLRYWAAEMHVDGFRFDLATALARDTLAFQPLARFFEIVRQDPLLAPLKLIAEPWDLGPEGYQLGRFPYGWAEWNDRFRDSVRRYWRGDPGQLPELASRLAGSSDLFAASGRGPQASINYVVSHDGMTLRDLVSYSRKHNEANGEQGRDGPQDESHNWGAEGPSRALRVEKLRARVRRNLLATLALAQGVPMIAHGDELGRTQLGNNNGYCQDSELTWIDWDLGAEDQAFLDFARELFAIRRDNAVFRRRHFFRGEAADPEFDDVSWLRPDGSSATGEVWQDPERRSLGMLIARASAEESDEAGWPQASETVLLLLNAHAKSRAFALPTPPEAEPAGAWHEIVNTACGTHRALRDGRIHLAPHSLALLAWRNGG